MDEEHPSPALVSRERKLLGCILETLGVYVIWASAFSTALGLIMWALHRTGSADAELAADNLLWLAIRFGWPVLLLGILAFLFGFAMWGVGARLQRRGGRSYTP